ncbi:MAG: hypothetical protein AAB571_12490 [Chloroflexota bacterium]
MPQTYPDISDLLKAKAKRRRELAALSWEEKVKIIERMQRLLPKGMWREKPTQRTRKKL